MQDIISQHILPYFEYPFIYLILNKYINEHANIKYVNWNHISSLDILTSKFIIRWKDKIIINFMSDKTCRQMNIYYFDKLPDLEDVEYDIPNIIFNSIDEMETALTDTSLRRSVWNNKSVTHNLIEKYVDILTHNDLVCLYEKQMLSQSFFDNYWKQISRSEWNYFISNMPESFILAHKDKILDFNLIFKYASLSESFIRSHLHFITDWSIIWQYQRLSESFISQYQIHISDWEDIWIHQTVSENFITNNFDNINKWYTIFQFQKLSYSFYLKYSPLILYHT